MPLLKMEALMFLLPQHSVWGVGLAPQPIYLQILGMRAKHQKIYKII